MDFHILHVCVFGLLWLLLDVFRYGLRFLLYWASPGHARHVFFNHCTNRKAIPASTVAVPVSTGVMLTDLSVDSLAKPFSSRGTPKCTFREFGGKCSQFHYNRFFWNKWFEHLCRFEK